MLHRAILGSLERFIGTLIEHYAGNFPLWLAPNQVMIIPIKNEHQSFAMQIKTALQQADIRAIVDDRNESLSKRIREASVKKIPYQIIIGDKEAQSSQVSVRLQNGSDLGAMSLEALLERLKKQIIDKR
jgi:threonyl-tRNA synthetase